MSEKLEPCPFCGAGETIIHVNKGTWNGTGYGEPVSVEIRHWCADVKGQPSRPILRIGRDEASAVAAWNKRAQHAGEAREPVAWHIGNADGSINKIGAVYIRRSLAEKHIASYAEGELDASIVPLYAAPQPAALPAGWQPIETAPKDGYAFLALLPDSDIAQPIWFDGEKFRHKWDNYVLKAADMPTHWMPLPAAPQPRE